VNGVAAAILGRVARWFKSSTATPRLSAATALDLARAKAMSEGYDPQALQMVTHREVDGRIRWHVSEAAVGSVLLVEIDDESGTVNFIRREPGR
jgi:hypothetical protein